MRKVAILKNETECDLHKYIAKLWAQIKSVYKKNLETLTWCLIKSSFYIVFMLFLSLMKKPSSTHELLYKAINTPEYKRPHGQLWEIFDICIRPTVNNLFQCYIRNSIHHTANNYQYTSQPLCANLTRWSNVAPYH